MSTENGNHGKCVVAPPKFDTMDTTPQNAARVGIIHQEDIDCLEEALQEVKVTQPTI